ncbi:MAG: hypothetical protein EOM12_06870 [Verrucomicrobiae bacterium]|nr:hypothetical protein [Verrucomicrobiae bacterium]
MKKLFILSFCLLALLNLFFTLEANASTDLLRERAKNLYSVQDYRAALSLFDRLLEEVPGDGEALDYSAWCLRYLGDWKSAEERFLQALEAPDGTLISWLYVGLGEMYLGAGDETKSAVSFQKAMEVAPEDNELLLRSLKGIIWAQAFLGDRVEYEKALSLLENKEKNLAEEVAADTASILEDREKVLAEKTEVAEEPTEPILVLDTVERQAKLLEDDELELEEELEEILAEVQEKDEPVSEDIEAAGKKESEQLEIVVLEEGIVVPTPVAQAMSPCESSDESAQPDATATDPETRDAESPTPALGEAHVPDKAVETTPAPKQPVKKPATRKPASKPAQSSVLASPQQQLSEVRGVRLGAPLEEELLRLEAKGVKLDRESTVDKNGVLRFALVPKTSFFPSNILSDAASEFYHIEGFSGFVLKVQGMLKTKPQSRPLEWTKTVFEAMVADFSSEYGKPAIHTDQGASSEAAWFIPDRRVLWIFADAGLDNTCSLQISYVDRRIQAGHLITILK